MKYVCQICGYVYDEDKEGVSFVGLPDDWKCPICKAAKSEFKELVEELNSAEEVEKTIIPQENIRVLEMSAGQMAALCTNFSRACEKQYKEKEAEQFAELAEYFTAVEPPVPNANVENVIAMLKWDLSTYPAVRAQTDADNDRGAARSLVWGEKVSRMLASLLDQYQKNGETMLAGKEIWVCTACGFVYIGDSAPEQCPVCKVPEWRFEKINGRA
ncbi:MAG: rubredoxin [Blautia sp.]|nr:rubredoxin [Blautia sp.]